MKKILLISLLLIISSQLIADVTDYTYSCWLNGWRKNQNDTSADLFAIETSQYGLALDMDDLSKAQFGLLSNPISYEQALEDNIEKS